MLETLPLDRWIQHLPLYIGTPGQVDTAPPGHLPLYIGTRGQVDIHM
jgi:hypothetical protein